MNVSHLNLHVLETEDETEGSYIFSIVINRHIFHKKNSNKIFAEIGNKYLLLTNRHLGKVMLGNLLFGMGGQFQKCQVALSFSHVP